MTSHLKKQKERGLLFERWPLITACWSPEPFAHAEDNSSPQHVDHLVGDLGHHTDILETDADEIVDRHRNGRAENQDAETHENLRLHCATSSRYWITTMPSWRGYRICRVFYQGSDGINDSILWPLCQDRTGWIQASNAIF